MVAAAAFERGIVFVHVTWLTLLNLMFYTILNCATLSIWGMESEASVIYP